MDDLFGLFTRRLDAAGVDYMVTGSVAAMIYGEPRLTHHVDVVVSLPASAIDAFVAAFPLEAFYCAPRDVIAVEAQRQLRGHFNVIHHETGFKADVYLVGGDPLHHWAMQRRRTIPIGEYSIVVAPPEYVIVRKLEFYREGGSRKHVEDIRGMLRLSADELDVPALEAKLAQLGLEQQWAEVAMGLGAS